MRYEPGISQPRAAGGRFCVRSCGGHLLASGYLTRVSGGDSGKAGGRSAAPTSASRGPTRSRPVGCSVMSTVSKNACIPVIRPLRRVKKCRSPTASLARSWVFRERQLEDRCDAQPVGRPKGDFRTMTSLAVARDMPFDHGLFSAPRRKMRRNSHFLNHVFRRDDETPAP